MHRTLSQTTTFLTLAAALACRDAARGADGAGAPRTAVLSQGIASFGAAASGGWLYVYGGHIGRTHEHSIDNLSHAFRRVNLIDRTTWEDLPMGPPLQGLALAAHGGSLYRVGGLSARNRRGEPEDLCSIADVARYDPERGVWTALPPLPEPRSSHDVVVAGGVLYVVGGWNIQGQTKTWQRGGWKCDLTGAEPKWEVLQGLAETRRALAVADAGGQLVAIGGLTTGGDATKAVELHDPATGEWTTGPDFPGMGFGVAAVRAGGRVWASGGDGKVFTLSDDRSRWDSAGSLAMPRIFHRLIAVAEDELLVIGGATRESHLRLSESLLLGAQGAVGAAIDISLPFPGKAKNRAAAFLVGDFLHLAGGNTSLEQHDFQPENFVAESFRVHLGSLAVDRRGSIPVPRQSMAATNEDGAAPLVLGGFGHDGEVERSHGEVLRYDARSDGWQALASLPAPRTQLGLAEHGGKVWVIGGLDYDPRRQGDAFRLPLEILTLDREGGTAFEPAATALPRPRRAFAGAQLGGKYYLIGGFRERFQPVEECDVLDLASGQWERIPGPARVRVSGELAALGGKLYLAGGSSPKAGGSGLEPNPTLERFDPHSGVWITLMERLPMATTHWRMHALRDRLLLHSTHHAEASALRIVILDPGAGEILVRRAAL
jgi:N-acetylneuraminic acid mutarotase